MSDRPISDSALSIVREMCDTVHPDIHLPAFIVKEMIAPHRSVGGATQNL